MFVVVAAVAPTLRRREDTILEACYPAVAAGIDSASEAAYRSCPAAAGFPCTVGAVRTDSDSAAGSPCTLVGFPCSDAVAVVAGSAVAADDTYSDYSVHCPLGVAYYYLEDRPWVAANHLASWEGILLATCTVPAGSAAGGLKG